MLGLHGRDYAGRWLIAWCGRVNRIPEIPLPKLNAVLYLSPDIRAELDQRLVESSFTRFAEHAEWLKSKGADISRSAIHRYSLDHWLRTVAALRSAVGTPSEKAAVSDLRIRALGVVVSGGPVTDEAFREAERVVDWAVGALPSPGPLEGGE